MASFKYLSIHSKDKTQRIPATKFCFPTQNIKYDIYLWYSLLHVSIFLRKIWNVKYTCDQYLFYHPKYKAGNVFKFWPITNIYFLSQNMNHGVWLQLIITSPCFHFFAFKNFSTGADILEAKTFLSNISLAVFAFLIANTGVDVRLVIHIYICFFAYKSCDATAAILIADLLFNISLVIFAFSLANIVIWE